MRLVFLISCLCIALFLSGCAHTFLIEPNAPRERYGEAQEFLHRNKPAKVELNTGKTWRATDLHIGADSTVFRIDGGTDRIVMLNDRIRTITTQDRRRGTQDGALVGAFSGALCGLFVGAIIAQMNSRDGEQYGQSDRDNGHRSSIVTSIGVGGGVGALMGAVVGHHSGAMRTVLVSRDPRDPRRWEYLPR